MQIQTRLRMVCPIALALVASAPVHAGDGCQPQWDNTIGQPGTNHRITALAAFDDGFGPALYAGGIFSMAGGVEANRIARWDPSSGEWSPLGSGMDGWVTTLTVFDDGSGGGPALYAGGTFLTAGGTTVNNIARWDGDSWSALGSGMSGPDGPYYVGVTELTVFDDGSGPALYVGGSFTTAGGVNASRIAKWDGTTWSPLGSGINAEQYWGHVHALAAFDDGSGSGPALYAGGGFHTADGMTVNHIARWDGQQWSALGSGMSSGIASLAVFDDGSGAALFASGLFSTAGGVTVNSIAKWDGQQWSALGTGMAGQPVAVLAVFDDGSGPALYAGGNFFTIGGVTVNHIAKWDGQEWTALGSGIESSACCPNIGALMAFDDGGGPALYVGGLFTAAGGLPTSYIAAWRGCVQETVAGDLDGDGTVGVFDLLILIDTWGPCADASSCQADLDGDGVVDVFDLLILLENWG